MTPQQDSLSSAGQRSDPHQPLHQRAAPQLPAEASNTDATEAGLELHRLANSCCSSGACRSVHYWPMGIPQEGWLQLDADPPATTANATPVDLVAFSSRGVGIVLAAQDPIAPGARGTLITPAHGAGCSHRPVRCCWQRPHPSDPQRQCAGLQFVHASTTARPRRAHS